MSESRGRWDMISNQLEQAAAKTNATSRPDALFDHEADGWPCWVPTSECLTLDDTEPTTMGLAS